LDYSVETLQLSLNLALMSCKMRTLLMNATTETPSDQQLKRKQVVLIWTGVEVFLSGGVDMGA
jgi:hypothetical protein